MLAVWVAWSAVASAGCGEDVLMALEQLEAAFRDDTPATAAAPRDVMRASIDCTEAVVEPALAARVHRAEALLAHLDGKDPDPHLRAMRRADPWLIWDVAGPEHPLTLRLAAVEEQATTVIPDVESVPEGWRVDGLALRTTPARDPAWLQQVDAQGLVTKSYLATGAPAVRESGPPRMLIAGLATAAAGAGLYGGAWAANSAYYGAVDAGDNDRIRSLHGATNALSVASLGLGAAAAGLLVVHFTR